MLLILVALMTSCISALVTPAWAADWVGTARVLEGDMLEINATRLRLYGIDAPEEGQPCKGPGGGTYDCAAEARRELERLIGDDNVRCRGVGRDPNNVTLVLCNAGSTDLNEEMVRSGWAVTFRSRDFQRREDEARANRRGMWQGRFERPEVWREQHSGKGSG